MSEELNLHGAHGADAFPTIYVISDSVGITGQSVARAAASQFGVNEPNICLLTQVKAFKEVREFLDEHIQKDNERKADHVEQTDSTRDAQGVSDVNEPDTTTQGAHVHGMVVFYSLVEDRIREPLQRYFTTHPHIVGVDIISSPIQALGAVCHKKPLDIPGEMHITDEHYFDRIEAVEFTIAHDDGNRPEDLTKADIVILGVSRCGKTPTSIYLSQQGYRVANVPLDPQTEPPKEIFQVDTTRLFGLMTTPDVLVGIRRRRLGKARGLASSYADPAEVCRDLDDARALMRRLGCIVIHTEKRAVEETAQEILRYYELAHPRDTGFSRN